MKQRFHQQRNTTAALSFSDGPEKFAEVQPAVDHATDSETCANQQKVLTILSFLQNTEYSFSMNNTQICLLTAFKVTK